MTKKQIYKPLIEENDQRTGQFNRLSSFSVVLVFVLLTLVGLLSVPLLQVSLNPGYQLPGLQVNYYYPGSDSRSIEREVTTKIEAALGRLQYIKKMESVSSRGYGYIRIDFQQDAPIDELRFETAGIIRQIYPELPASVSYPTITVNTPDDKDLSPMLSYTIDANSHTQFIKEQTEHFVMPHIAHLEGVARIEVSGAAQMVWEIQLDNELMSRLQIDENYLIHVLQTQFNNRMLGNIITDNQHNNQHAQYVYVRHPNMEIEALRQTPVANYQGRVLHLSDVAKIEQKAMEQRSFYRIDGRNAVQMHIFAEKNANELLLAGKIKQKMAEIALENHGLTINMAYDSSGYLQVELRKLLLRTLATLAILFLFVLIVSRNARYLLIIVLSLTANISIAFMLYSFFEVNIHLYSLAGITVSLGFVIDNSIVMLDHLRRKNDRKVIVPIFAASLTTMASLSVIFFLDKQAQLALLDFAAVLIINLSISVLIALFYIPALAYKLKIYRNIKTKTRQLKFQFVKAFANRIYSRWIQISLQYRKILIVLLILLFGLPVHKLPDYWQGVSWYHQSYNAAMSNHFVKEYVKPILIKTLGGTLRLFDFYVFQHAYYGKKQEIKLVVSAGLGEGTTVAQMNAAIVPMEDQIKKSNTVKHFITRVQKQHAQVEITFKPEFADGNAPYILKNELISHALNADGVHWNIYGIGKSFYNAQGGGGLPSYIVAVYGYNYDELLDVISGLKRELTVHPRVNDVRVVSYGNWESYKRPLNEFVLNFDDNVLHLQNIAPAEAYQKLRKYGISTAYDMQLLLGSNLEYLRLQDKNAANFDAWKIVHKPLMHGQSTTFPGKNAKLTLQRSQNDIIKINQEYRHFVEFNYVGAAKFGNKHLENVLEIMQPKLPMGYYAVDYGRRSGIYGLIEKTELPYYLLVLVIALIFLICAILLESLKQSVAVILTIPLSFIGIFMAFYWFNINFDQGGYASFILVSGLTVNALLFVINEFNILIKQNPEQNQLQLYQQALRQKISPILLAAFSTILSLLPFLYGGQNEVFWYALAAGTIGGMISSIFVLLIIFPALFLNSGDRQ